MKLKESHLSNMSPSTIEEEAMKCCQKKPKSNMSSQKENQVNPLSTGSLACSNAEQPIKTIQQLKSMKDQWHQLQEPMKSMEFHLNNMSPSITVEEAMKLHQKKSQHQRNHQPMPLQDLLDYSRKEPHIKTK